METKFNGIMKKVFREPIRNKIPINKAHEEPMSFVFREPIRNKILPISNENKSTSSFLENL